MFAGIESDVELELMIKHLANETGVSPEALFSEVQQVSQKKRRVLQRSEERRERRLQTADKQDVHEKMLLGILYEQPGLAETLNINADFFHKPDHRLIYQMIETGNQAYGQLSEEQQGLLSEIAVRELHLEDRERAARQLVDGIRQMRNQQLLEQGATDAAQLQQLLLQDKRSKHKQA